MAWTEKRGQKHKGLYRDTEGVKRSVGTYTTPEAAMEAAKFAENNQRDSAVKTADRIETVSDLFYHWLDNKTDLQIDTRQRYRRVFENHVQPHLGKRKVQTIVPADAIDVVKRLEKAGRSAALQKDAKSMMAQPFQLAVRLRLVAHSPVDTENIKATKAKPIRILSKAEFKQMWEALPNDDLRVMFRVAVFTGTRFGELAALKPKHFDFESTPGMAMLHVHQSLTEVGKKHNGGVRYVEKGWTKTGDQRDVEVDPKTTRDVLAMIERRGLGPDDVMFGWEILPKVEEHAWLTDEFVATLDTWTVGKKTFRHGTAYGYGDGKCRCAPCRAAASQAMAIRRERFRKMNEERYGPRRQPYMDRQSFQAHITDAAKAARLEFRPTIHHLRHTHISWLRDAGLPADQVMPRVGHKDLRTLDRYTHKVRVFDDRAVSVLASFEDDDAPTTPALTLVAS